MSTSWAMASETDQSLRGVAAWVRGSRDASITTLGSVSGNLADRADFARRVCGRASRWIEGLTCKSRRDGYVGYGRAPKRAHRQKSFKLAALWPYQHPPIPFRLLMLAGSICDWRGRPSAEEPGSSPAKTVTYLQWTVSVRRSY